jgi:hypothetical protein
MLFLLTAVIVLVAAWLWFLPPRWWLNTIKPVDLTDPVGAGTSIVAAYNCRQCHFVGGEGKALGPNLNGVTERLDAVSLRQWLRGNRPRSSMIPRCRISGSPIPRSKRSYRT